MAVLLPLALAFLYRLTPRLRDALLARFAFDLQPYHPLIASSFITSAPGIAGMVIGFLLLDERNDGILLAVAVTPIELRAYAGYRIAAGVAQERPRVQRTAAAIRFALAAST